MENPGSKFLHDRNPNLHNSQEVEGVINYLRANGEQIPNQPAEKIEGYLGFLANKDYVNDGILTGNQESINRQIEAHVIKAEDVPESYFELQRRIAREQGHGDVRITDTLKEQLVEAVQSDQRSALGKWVEYLGGDDGSYPNWFKHYTWNSVTKLGNYDKEKGEFLKRSKGTTAPYPELNREALAYVFDAVNKRVTGEQVEGDEQLQKLLKAGNFGKLYAHAVLKLQPATPEQLKNIEGSWTKYERSDDPRTARRLAGSLQGHGTGWCTAGESTAETQLKNGDFYVYYTKDEDGKDSVPRVAIRMQGGKVAEVRGINQSQELEPVMTDIALERLKDLPGGEEYTQKAKDMKRLTELERKLTENPEAELTREEVAFLYEVERPIQGFGYEKDPRVGELAGKRGLLRDMATLFGTDPEDSQATINAMVEAEQERRYRNLSLDKVVEQCTGLNSELAQLLIDSGKSFVVRKHLNSFSGLNDEMAQMFIEDIRGIDLLSFGNLSEDTFYRLVDEFSKSGRGYDYREETTLWRLLEKGDTVFNLPDHQKIANFLMDKEKWSEAARMPHYFDDVDSGAIAERMLAEGKIEYVAMNIKNFPTVNHQELAERLIKESPSRLAMSLRDLNVDKNVYARKVIEAGKMHDLYTYASRIEGYDQDVLDAFEAHKVAMEERAEAQRKREEEYKIQQAEWEREEAENFARWQENNPYSDSSEYYA